MCTTPYTELNLQNCNYVKNDAFVAKIANTRLTKVLWPFLLSPKGCQLLPPWPILSQVCANSDDFFTNSALYIRQSVPYLVIGTGPFMNGSYIIVQYLINNWHLQLFLRIVIKDKCAKVP